MNLIRSIFSYKCPRCRKGDIFTKPLNISDPLNMPEKCAVCEQKTEPEPGFYYGAMFISYGITAFMFLGIAGAGIIFFGLSPNASMGVVILVGILLFLKVLRLSRSIWIHIIVKHEQGVY